MSITIQAREIFFAQINLLGAIPMVIIYFLGFIAIIIIFITNKKPCLCYLIELRTTKMTTKWRLKSHLSSHLTLVASKYLIPSTQFKKNSNSLSIRTLKWFWRNSKRVPPLYIQESHSLSCLKTLKRLS